MKPLAAMSTDRRTGPAARLGANHGLSGFATPTAGPKHLPAASQAFAENYAKDLKGDSYAITSGILKPNIYHKGHNFPPGPIRPELPRQEPRQLLSAGWRAMKANFSVSQSAPGRARRQACVFWKGASNSAFSLNMSGARTVEGALWEG
jgi:hypothetical protein